MEAKLALEWDTTEWVMMDELPDELPTLEKLRRRIVPPCVPDALPWMRRARPPRR